MRIAIPVWNGRVSPVFDVAKKIRVVDIDAENGSLVATATRTLEAGGTPATLTELGVNLLICSAISVPVDGICGPADDIVEAFIAGDTTLARFNAPGNARDHRPASELSARRRSSSKTSRGGGR
jgi:hypothetical protein